MQQIRLIATWMMLLPFFGTSLVASNVMPVAARDGAIMLVICSGQGMTEMAFDPVTMKPLPDADGDASKTGKAEYCAWATAHPLADTPDASPSAILATSFSIQTTLIGDTVLRVAEATGLPPATGPPSAL